MRVAEQNPGRRLREDPPDEPPRLPQLLRQALDLQSGDSPGSDRAGGHLLRRGLGLPTTAPVCPMSWRQSRAIRVFTGSCLACRLSCTMPETRRATLRIRSRSSTMPSVTAVRSRCSVRVSTRTPSAKSVLSVG